MNQLLLQKWMSERPFTHTKVTVDNFNNVQSQKNKFFTDGLMPKESVPR
jgi:hypothetical protein